MTDVLDSERIKRFRTIRNDLLKQRDAVAIRLDHMRKLRISTERELRELDQQIGIATRNLRRAEKPLSEYVAEIVKEEDAGRGYYAMVLAEANRRKNADILESTGAADRRDSLATRHLTPATR